MRNVRARVLGPLVVALSFLAAGAWGAWDKTKPAASTPLASSEIRSNWASIETALHGVDLVADNTFLIWPAGDATAPAHWQTAGTGVAIARAGTGLGDTTRKVGLYTIKLTSGAAALGQVFQDVLPAAQYDDSFDSRKWSAGAWVRTSTANCVRLRLSNGGATGPNDYSTFHSGGGSFEWLTIAGATIDGDATVLTFGMDVCQGTNVGYLSGPTVILGEVPPSDYIPAPVTVREHRLFLSGAQTTGTRKVGGDFYFPRPTLVQDVELAFQTAVPTGQAYIVDVNHFDGAAQQTMFSTRPQVAAGTAIGTPAAPDGTYRYRCFSALTTASQTDRLLTVDVDQVGSGAAGTDAYVLIRYKSFDRPLETFLTGPNVN